MSPYDRVMARVAAAENNCIVFKGNCDRKGYGRLTVGSVTNGTKRTVSTHRVVWAEANGPIPEGLLVRHSCDNPPCVNIEHLLIGTWADNVADMVERGRHGESKRTHCPAGHEYDEVNTLVNKGKRYCRECNRRIKRERRARAAATPATLALPSPPV